MGGILEGVRGHKEDIFEEDEEKGVEGVVICVIE